MASVKGAYFMGPDELIEELREMRVFTSRRTLLRYEEKGLISEPVRGNNGRGRGRFTEYSASAPYEFYASWYCIKCCNKVERVALAREQGLKLWNEYKDTLRIQQMLAENCTDELAVLIPQWIDSFLELNPQECGKRGDSRNLQIHRWKVIIKRYQMTQKKLILEDDGWSREEIDSMIKAYEEATGEKIREILKNRF